MVAFFDSISPQLAEWAEQQPVFFTASAPLAGKHINVSPKGMTASTFHILSPTRVAYIDATGSGSETISHVYENGRVTVMFCSFGPNPRILRLFCSGRVVEWDQPEFERLLKTMAKAPVEGARAVIVLDVWKVGRRGAHVRPHSRPPAHP
jgi:Pyridoxamine 5'-phosphate oxidase